MHAAVNYWPLIGIAVISLTFVLRLNPLLGVLAAAIASAVAANFPLWTILEQFGEYFLKTRNLTLLTLLPLGVIGLMERHGLREKAQDVICKFRQMTVPRLLISYLLARQLTASIGLTSLGGQPQMIRPIIAPMVEAIAVRDKSQLNSAQIDRLKALAAATDNVGLFFGEDIFIAFGAVALIAAFMNENNLPVELLNVALWGIPTALFAFVIHSTRIWLIDKFLVKKSAESHQ